MSLGIRIGQRRQSLAQAQGTTLGPYGLAPDAQGMRPSALMVQCRRSGGASAHSATVEGSQDLAGPWEVLVTVTDELNKKVTTIPDYVRVVLGTVTGGTLDVTLTGAVN